MHLLIAYLNAEILDRFVNDSLFANKCANELKSLIRKLNKNQRKSKFVKFKKLLMCMQYNYVS